MQGIINLGNFDDIVFKKTKNRKLSKLDSENSLEKI
jgi:hypothetical protein